METIVLPKESYRIIGACFEVYKHMGSGFLESVYQECLQIEFRSREIPFAEKPRLRLAFKEQELAQTYEPDFVCFGEIIVELKAASRLGDEHRAQAINYLRSTGKPLALLINFGSHPRMEHERFVNQRDSRSSRIS